MPDFRKILEDKNTRARRAVLKLKHGEVQTPCFMPVGTYGAVRGLSAHELESAGAEIMLSNTYHLVSRPGVEVIESVGGLHKFNNWNKPILTDSGGFQVFSLSKNRKLNEEGAKFKDPFDGRNIEFTPENVVGFQEKFGSDIMMMLDECPPSDSDSKLILEAVDRTTRWAKRGKAAQVKNDLALFPIFQGGCDLQLREKSLKDILELEKSADAWPGIAIGGLSVGETKQEFVDTLFGLRTLLPSDRPRYLMGVGTPRDLVFSVACGVDMFDCVIPSRNARHGIVMTSEGRLNILNQKYRDDPRPLDPQIEHPILSGYSRAFIRHLFQIGEQLGPRLATLHNIHYFVGLMAKIRQHLEAGTFYDFAKSFLFDPSTEYLGRENNFRNYPAEF